MTITDEVVITAELSGWWRRVGATLIDWLVLIVPALLLGWLTGADHVTHTASGAHTTIRSNWTYAVLIALYVMVLLPRPSRNGQTLGKHVLGIRIVRDDGHPVDYATVLRRDVPWKAAVVLLATARFMGTGVVLLAFGIQLIDCLWPLWDSQNRALHDFTAFTHVIRLPQSGKQITLPVQPQ